MYTNSPELKDAAVNVEFIPPGIWFKVMAARSSKPHAAIFLDRDGVIVEDSSYLSKIADIRLVSGAAGLIAAANAANLPVVVITNQSGIARGFYDWDTFAKVQQDIERQLNAANARLSAVVACPFHPDFSDDYARSLDGWRKPGPNMIRLAAERLNINLARSAFVGDHFTDISAANAAGLVGGVLVMTGHGKTHLEAVHRLSGPGFRVAVASDPGGAIEPLREFGLPI